MKFIIFVVVVLVIYFLLSNSKPVKLLENAPIENRKNLLDTIKKSGASGVEYLSYNYKSAAILDEDNKKLYIYNMRERDSYNQFSYDYSVVNLDDIIESEVIIDDHTITKTGRGSQAVGVAVGGALLGGVGSIIGGLSGSQNSFKQIKNIDIKLTVNDLNNPIYKINFLNSETSGYTVNKTGHRKDSFEYEKAIEQVDKWQGMFDVILKRQENK